MNDSQDIVTRCPGCSTAFRAGHTQLAARGGKVRCGRCDTVFDAREHALTDAVPVPPQAGEGTTSEQAHDELVLTYAPAGAPDQDASVEDQADTIHPAEVADPNLELDFGKSAITTTAARQWLAVIAAIVLFLALAGQAVFHFRGDIALLFPAMKAPIERACAQLGCRLPLPKRVDMLSIESSDLQADTLNPGIMVLSATLRNRAPFSQTPPALELTLTDAQDQALARRVLVPSDYVRSDSMDSVENSFARQSLFPGGTELPIKVYFDASAVKPTGYRLYLFYP